MFLRNKFAQWVLVLLCLCGLSGCGSYYNLDQIQSNFIQGNHEAVVDEYLANESTIEPNLLVYRIILCESLYAMRDYARLQQCTDDYVQRVVGKYDSGMHARALSLIHI